MKHFCVVVEVTLTHQERFRWSIEHRRRKKNHLPSPNPSSISTVAVFLADTHSLSRVFIFHSACAPCAVLFPFHFLCPQSFYPVSLSSSTRPDAHCASGSVLGTWDTSVNGTAGSALGWGVHSGGGVREMNNKQGQ